MNENLSYSFHIGNDKNKTTKAKQLSKVNHHNLRAYENNPELIMTIKGTNDIVKDIKEVYLDVFEDSRIKYNNKQTRNDRKIQDYFFKIAHDNKHDLAVEIIIQLGNMNYWADKTIEEKYKMTDVFKNQVKELEKIVPLFKIANATIHFDESSPHLHIVGVPIKENCKTGMNKQVGKSDVFTVEILELIQTELREICINDFNKLFNLDKELKEKESGRNEDYKVKQMKDYEKLKNSYNKQHKKITEINKNVDKINTKSNEVKDILENLKQQPLSKNNLIISSDKKDKLLEFIKDIDKNNKNMKSITNFNLSLNDIKNDLEENHETIRELLNENEDLNVKLEEKERLLQVSKNTISELKKKISNLEEQVNYWKNKFTKIVNHIKDKVLGLFGKDEEHIYRNIANDLYINNKVSYEDYENMLGRNTKNKNKDDDIEI